MTSLRFLLLAAVLLGGPGEIRAQTDCLSGFTKCAAQFEADVSATTTNAATCSAVDAMLDCLAAETATCDPVVAAQVGASTTGTIEAYQGPPYNCTLASASNPVFAPDDCALALDSCTNLHYLAEFALTYVSACSNFDNYLVCMKENATSSCQSDVTRHAFVQGKITETTASMNDNPYYCLERKTYDLDGCEIKFEGCLDDFIGLISNKTAKDALLVCKAVPDLEACVDQTARPLCSPRQEGYNNVSLARYIDLTVKTPFYCRQANQCDMMFSDCKAAASLPANSDPCLKLDVLRDCLATVSKQCAANQIGSLEDKVKAEMEAINQFNDCSSTTRSTIDTTTPTISSTVSTTGTPRNSDAVTTTTSSSISGSSTTRSTIDTTTPTISSTVSTTGTPGNSDAVTTTTSSSISGSSTTRSTIDTTTPTISSTVSTTGTPGNSDAVTTTTSSSISGGHSTAGVPGLTQADSEGRGQGNSAEAASLPRLAVVLTCGMAAMLGLGASF